MSVERDTSQYVVDGKRVVSVTEALEIAGIVDLSGIPLRLLELARDRGKAAHRVTAMIDLGEDVGRISDDVKPYAEAWQRFRVDTGFKSDLIEYVVRHERLGYAGTLDRFGPLNGCETLIDVKCGYQPGAWTGLQLAGYDLALEYERYIDKPSKRMAVSLKPDGTYSIQQFRKHSDRADFLAAVRVAQWLIRHGRVTL
jgi:hypothetical protein